MPGYSVPNQFVRDHVAERYSHNEVKAVEGQLAEASERQAAARAALQQAAAALAGIS